MVTKNTIANNFQEKGEKLMKESITLFLSYCSKDENIADIIDRNLRQQIGEWLKITKYTRDVEYKDSFKEFMNSICEHDYALSIVSDNYLKSVACMYEVGEVLKDHNFTKKLLFVVLNEEDRQYYNDSYQGKVQADIYDVIKKAEYTIYWQLEYRKLKNKIDEIEDYEAKRELTNNLSMIKKILDFDVEPFMAYVSDAKGISFSSLVKNEFKEIINYIFPEYNDIFKDCDTYEKLFEMGIKKIYEITKTDYNQIILFVKFDSHSSGLVVATDIISPHKQRYRKVAVDGIIDLAYRNGSIINIDNVEEHSRYFSGNWQTKSELAVPIKFEGNSIGVINVESEKTSYFTEEKVIKIESIANLFGIALSKLGFDRIYESDIPYMSFTLKVKTKE